MVMKKTLGILLLAIAMFTVAACSDSKFEDYELVIPKEADIVVSAKLNNIVSKSGLAQSPLFVVGKNHLEGLVGSEMRDLLNEVIDDPSLTGISFESPAYLFGIKGSIWGATMKIEDESLTEKFITSLSDNGLCGKVKKHDGLCWTTLLDDINIVYSDNTLLFILQTSSKNRMDNEKFMLSLMELEEESAFVTTSKYAKMTEIADEDLQMYMNFAAFPSIKAKADGFVPLNIMSKGLEMTAGMTVENSELKVKATLFSSDSTAQKQIDSYFNGFKPIRGDYEGQIPRSSSTWACLGMDGRKMIGIMNGIPKIKEMLLGANLGIDADNMIRSINGDVLVCIGQHDLSNVASGIKVYAQLDNTDFMKDVNYWIKSANDYGLTLSPLSNHDFLLKSDDLCLYWAVNGKELYLGTQRYHALGGYKTGSPADDDMAGNLMYVYVNLTDNNPIFSHAIIKSAKSGEFAMDVYMSNLEKNMLNGLLNSLWKQ